MQSVISRESEIFPHAVFAMLDMQICCVHQHKTARFDGDFCLSCASHITTPLTRLWTFFAHEILLKFRLSDRTLTHTGLEWHYNSKTAQKDILQFKILRKLTLLVLVFPQWKIREKNEMTALKSQNIWKRGVKLSKQLLSVPFILHPSFRPRQRRKTFSLRMLAGLTVNSSVIH